MIELSGTGVTLSLITSPDSPINAELSSRMRDAVLAAITVGLVDSRDRADGAARDGLVARTLALDAIVKDAPEVLSDGEAALMHEWLQRLAATSNLTP